MKYVLDYISLELRRKCKVCADELFLMPQTLDNFEERKPARQAIGNEGGKNAAIHLSSSARDGTERQPTASNMCAWRLYHVITMPVSKETSPCG